VKRHDIRRRRAVAPLSAPSAEEGHASTVLVHLDAEAVELHLMKPANTSGRSAGRNEVWMQHFSRYTKRRKNEFTEL
jgi:hypothetical protein